MERLRALEHTTIHSFAGVAAGIGGGLSGLPGSDAPILASLQAAMVLALAELHDVPMNRTAAAELAITLSASMLGRQLSRGLIRFLPGIGVGANAVIAAAVTESVGWAAVAWFRQGSAM